MAIIFGADRSGNANNWTSHNLSVTAGSTYDSMVDVPGIASVSSQPDVGGVQRGNYATLNPLYASNGSSYTNVNLQGTTNGSSAVQELRSTIEIPTSGKWYCEMQLTDFCTSPGGTARATYGVHTSAAGQSSGLSFRTESSHSSSLTSAAIVKDGTIQTSVTVPSTNDVLGFAINSDASSIEIFRQGSSIYSGSYSFISGNLFIGVSGDSSGEGGSPRSTTTIFNFGQRPFAYTVPTGFKSICTTNLPNPVIKRPVEHFDVKTYTGNGSGLTVGTTVKQSSAYAINNSLRFRGSNSATLSRTPSVSGNRKVWTWSAWVKRGRLDSSATDYVLFSSPSFPSTNDGIAAIYFNANKIHTYYDTSGSNPYGAIGDALYLDTTSWMNIVWSVDAANTRHSVWVNGVLVSTDSSKFPPNYEYTMNNSGYTHTMGTQAWGASNYFDGYMAEVNFVDGQSLTPSSFGDYDANNNWMPKRYTGTYGTNGFYLPFTGDSFAGSFNGTTQYLQTSLPATLTGAFTIEFFFYRNGTGNNHTFTLGDCKTSTGVQYYIGTSGSVQQIYSNDASVISSSSNLPVSNAWNHVAFTRDSGQVTRLFVNGVQVGSTWATSAAFSSTLRIGTEFYNSAHTAYTNGGLSNFRIVNGTALYTSNFTPPTSELTAVSGTAILTLQSSTIIDNSSNSLSITNNNNVVTSTTMLGNRSKDYSPQGNNWTNNNIGVLPGSTLDIMIDSPADTVDSSGNVIGNYATLNPTSPYGTNTATSNGNLTSTASSTANDRGYPSSLAASGSGKWYAEFTFTTTNSDNNGGCGIMLADGTGAPGESATTVSWRDFGTLRQNASGTTYGTALSANEVVMVAYDADLGRVWFGKQGTWFASGNPATNANPSATDITSSGRFATYHYNSAATIQANFGQRPFAYTPPTGFKSLNSKNLKDVGSYNLPDTFGNFVNTPDLVWSKNRSNARSHALVDTVRGATNQLRSDTTGAQFTGGFSSIITNGFTLNNNMNENNTGETYVAWAWNRGKTPGFDIVNYGGDGVNGRMIPHNLGVTPAFYITKCLTSYNNSQGFNDWSVYHQSCPTYTGNSRQGKQALWLHSILGAANGVGGFFNTATSTEFSPNQINYDNSSGQSYIAYLWAEVPGFSKFGGYTGNNDNNGPFIYLGFRPRFILLKKIGEASTTYGWQIYDTARSPANLANLPGFWADTTAAEAPNTYAIDLVSNGFKIRTNNLNMNNGSTFVYAAWAESPFKYANAR